MVAVAIGIIINSQQQVLVEQRPQNISYGGYWAFPGGKVEENETIFDALIRELREEIDITVQDAEPFMYVQHQYPERIVDLHTWRITSYTGEPHGHEGQLIRWVTLAELIELNFLPPNQKIVQAVIKLL